MTHWFSVLKMPWDARRRGWKKATYWEANPEAIKYWVMDNSVGASAILPQQGYEGMELFSNKLVNPTFDPPHDLPTNRWNPRQYLEDGRVGIFAVFNWRSEKLVQKWEVMQLSSDDPDAGAEMHGAYTGAITLELQPDHIGLMVTQVAPYNKDDQKVEWKDAKMEVDIFYPRDSTWFGEGRARDAQKYGGERARTGGLETLTNAEGALLWIYTNIKNLKEKKSALADFNLGSTDKTQNERLEGLFQRGFFRSSGRDQYEGGEEKRALPIISDKGKAHAPEMTRDQFFGKFRTEVINNPDGLLVLKDHGEWVDPEIGFDVAVEQEDRRPDYMRRMEDD